MAGRCRSASAASRCGSCGATGWSRRRSPATSPRSAPRRTRCRACRASSLERFDLGADLALAGALRRAAAPRAEPPPPARRRIRGVRDRLPEGADPAFWKAVRGNLDLLGEARQWWEVVRGTRGPAGAGRATARSCAPRSTRCRPSPGMRPPGRLDRGAEGRDRPQGQRAVPAAAPGPDRRGPRAGPARPPAADRPRARRAAPALGGDRLAAWPPCASTTA